MSSSARRSRLQAAASLRALCGIARTMLASSPAHKQLLDAANPTNSVITTSIASLLLHIRLRADPVVSILEDAVAAQESAAGGGCVWMVVLAGLLAGAADALQREGMPLGMIMRLLGEAMGEAKQVLLGSAAVRLEDLPADYRSAEMREAARLRTMADVPAAEGREGQGKEDGEDGEEDEEEEDEFAWFLGDAAPRGASAGAAGSPGSDVAATWSASVASSTTAVNNTGEQAAADCAAVLAAGFSGETRLEAELALAAVLEAQRTGPLLLDRICIHEQLGVPAQRSAAFCGVALPLDPAAPSTSQLRALVGGSPRTGLAAALVQGHIEDAPAPENRHFVMTGDDSLRTGMGDLHQGMEARLRDLQRRRVQVVLVEGAVEGWARDWLEAQRIAVVPGLGLRRLQQLGALLGAEPAVLDAPARAAAMGRACVCQGVGLRLLEGGTVDPEQLLRRPKHEATSGTAPPALPACLLLITGEGEAAAAAVRRPLCVESQPLAGPVMVLVCAPVAALLAAAAHSVRERVAHLVNALQCGAVTYGGGGFEVLAAASLRQRAAVAEVHAAELLGACATAGGTEHPDVAVAQRQEAAASSSVPALNGALRFELAALKPIVLRAMAKCFDDIALIRAQNDGASFGAAAEALVACHAWLREQGLRWGDEPIAPLPLAVSKELLRRPPARPELWSEEAGADHDESRSASCLADVTMMRHGLEQAERIVRLVMNSACVLMKQRGPSEPSPAG